MFVTDPFASLRARQMRYSIALIQIRYAEKIRCVRCDRVFAQSDIVTECPNATEGNHALIPEYA